MRKTCLSIMAACFAAAVALSSYGLWVGVMSVPEVGAVVLGCSVAILAAIFLGEF